MNFFIYRNSTIEHLFGNCDFSYSGYNDISRLDESADAFVWFYILPFDSNPGALISEINSYFERIKMIHGLLKGRTFYIFTLFNFNELKFVQSDTSVQDSIREFNTAIYNFSTINKNIKVIDIWDFTRHYSANELVDWKHYFMSNIIINPRLSGRFREWFFRQVDITLYKRKKCLVIDLDNTVWGGILGEDGIHGVQIGVDYPGNAYSLFQHYLVELSKTGIILSVCSKNNEQDVFEMFEKNPSMKLKKEHIAAYRINWNNKSDNIKEIARELNIGLDSMVFIDDNPAETDLIKGLLPEVETPVFPQQPYQLPAFFSSLLDKYFSTYSLTEEDTAKTAQYKSNLKRLHEKNQYSDFSDYLKSLDLLLSIKQADDFSISRVSQMTQKTNQFNLTTKRYNDTDIRNFCTRKNSVFSIRVSDKFGDNGITGVAILNYKNDNFAKIDSFLLSCRILGKGVEQAFIGWLLDSLLKNGVETVEASYIPTDKNMQVQDFWDKTGFELIEAAENVKTYKMKLKNKVFELPDYCKIEYHEK